MKAFNSVSFAMSLIATASAIVQETESKLFKGSTWPHSTFVDRNSGASELFSVAVMDEPLSSKIALSQIQEKSPSFKWKTPVVSSSRTYQHILIKRGYESLDPINKIEMVDGEVSTHPSPNSPSPPRSDHSGHLSWSTSPLFSSPASAEEKEEVKMYPIPPLLTREEMKIRPTIPIGATSRISSIKVPEREGSLFNNKKNKILIRAASAWKKCLSGFNEFCNEAHEFSMTDPMTAHSYQNYQDLTGRSKQVDQYLDMHQNVYQFTNLDQSTSSSIEMKPSQQEEEERQYQEALRRSIEDAQYKTFPSSRSIKITEGKKVNHGPVSETSGKMKEPVPVTSKKNKEKGERFRLGYFKDTDRNLYYGSHSGLKKPTLQDHLEDAGKDITDKKSRVEMVKGNQDQGLSTLESKPLTSSTDSLVGGHQHYLYKRAVIPDREIQVINSKVVNLIKEEESINLQKRMPGGQLAEAYLHVAQEKSPLQRARIEAYVEAKYGHQRYSETHKTIANLLLGSPPQRPVPEMDQSRHTGHGGQRGQGGQGRGTGGDGGDDGGGGGGGNHKIDHELDEFLRQTPPIPDKMVGKDPLILALHRFEKLKSPSHGLMDQFQHLKAKSPEGIVHDAELTDPEILKKVKDAEKESLAKDEEHNEAHLSKGKDQASSTSAEKNPFSWYDDKNMDEYYNRNERKDEKSNSKDGIIDKGKGVVFEEGKSTHSTEKKEGVEFDEEAVKEAYARHIASQWKAESSRQGSGEHQDEHDKQSLGTTTSKAKTQNMRHSNKRTQPGIGGTPRRLLSNPAGRPPRRSFRQKMRDQTKRQKANRKEIRPVSPFVFMAKKDNQGRIA